MDKAEQAYEAARRRIAQIKRGAGDRLDLSAEEYRALTEIPTEIAQLDKLQLLILSNTQVKNLAPLIALRALHYVNLENTPVSDISWLSELQGLEDVGLKNTKIRDIAPLRSLKLLEFSP